MTQIAARDKSNATSNLVHGLRNARSETKMIVVRQETVAKRDDFSVPTVAQQEIKRHGRAVVQQLVNQHRDAIFFRGCRALDGRQQLFVDTRGERRAHRLKVREVGIDARTFISHERIDFETRVRRDQNDGLRAGFDDAPREFGHRVDRGAHTGDGLASNLRHHNWRMGCNAGKH